jgi:F-type H+-transporting ATPase subunit b
MSEHAALSLWAVLNFVVLAGVIVYLLRKPNVQEMILGQSFEARHHSVKKEIEEAEALRKSVEVMVRDYKGKLEKLDSEIDSILKQARADGDRERAQILERAERLAEKIKNDAILAAEKEKQRMQFELERQTLVAAAKQAAEMLKNRVTEKDHHAFTQELIENLSEGRPLG